MSNSSSDEELSPLNFEYTFWITFFKKSKDKQLQEFEDNLKNLGNFKTVEGFWGIYQHMRRPDNLPRGSTFFLFRSGIRPMWEDEANIGGGRFYFNMKKSKITNKIWEDLQIHFILTDSKYEKLNGVVMNVRTSEVILSIWTKRIDQEEEDFLREWIYKVLEFSNDQAIEFKRHPNNEQLVKKQEELIKEEEERLHKLMEQKQKEEMKLAKQKEREEALASQQEQQENEQQINQNDEQDDQSKEKQIDNQFNKFEFTLNIFCINFTKQINQLSRSNILNNSIVSLSNENIPSNFIIFAIFYSTLQSQIITKLLTYSIFQYLFSKLVKSSFISQLLNGIRLQQTP